jgi:hypothetical protein
MTLLRRHWRALSPSTPFLPTRSALAQPEFQAYSPIHPQLLQERQRLQHEQEQQEQQPSLVHLNTNSPARNSSVPSAVSYASHSLPHPSFPLPNLNVANASMSAFEAQAAVAAATADELSALAAEKVISTLRFVAADVEESADQQRSEQNEHLYHQAPMQNLSLSRAMQPLPPISYSEDMTTVARPVHSSTFN